MCPLPSCSISCRSTMMESTGSMYMKWLVVLLLNMPRTDKTLNLINGMITSCSSPLLFLLLSSWAPDNYRIYPCCAPIKTRHTNYVKSTTGNVLGHYHTDSNIGYRNSIWWFDGPLHNCQIKPAKNCFIYYVLLVVWIPTVSQFFFFKFHVYTHG